MESIERPLEGMTIDDDSCGHLNAVADTLKDNYHIIMAYYVTCIAEGASKRKATDVYCRNCKAKNKRIYVCLECPYFGCFDYYEYEFNEQKVVSSHMLDHAAENDHYFAININHGCLFCFMCKDVVYNKTFEDILSEYKAEARKINGTRSYEPFLPKAEEIVHLKNKVKRISEDSFIGLRGITNIGNSCYASCILQVLMHTPLLRDFFLSDQHRCFKRKPDTCLMCEMFRMFQGFYSGKMSPYNPVSFFEAMRKYSSGYIGIEQQDTFELFTEILTGLESSCKETHDFDNCDCLIHQMFYGVNENYRKCSVCEVSSLLPPDHFVDIMLDLNGDNDSLPEILKRKFSKPEKLTGYKCSNCKKTSKTFKYTTIKKLPMVICFHMNCFGTDSGTTSTGRRSRKPLKITKKSTAFEFKESIEMSDYLSSNVYKPCALEGNRYYLYGVIYHKGKNTQGGHYVTFIKQRKNRWFECDDRQVSVKSVNEVLKCEPYLIFYYKEP